MTIDNMDFFDWFLFALFSIAIVTQLIYYIGFYLRAARSSTRSKPGKKKAVSVIICARNEAENLRKFLPSVLQQDYPDFEVIVVNDCSDDETEEVLNNMKNIYTNLVVTTIHKDASLRHSKKMALFLGIKAASNEHLLLTDADCQPVTSNWIKNMMYGFSDSTNFVLGYGGYIREKGLLNKYIRYDTMFIAMQYMGMALGGFPYMGVGRNLAYRRSVFFNNKGFGPHLNLQSGDDDLFVNSLATRTNTTVITAKDAHTRSVPCTTWSCLVKQKMRHLSTSSHYKGITKFLLGLEPFSRMLMYGLLAVLLIGKILSPVVLTIFMTAMITRFIVTSLSQKSLNESDLLLFSPLFDVASLFINGYFLLMARRNVHRTYEWK